MYTYCLFSYIRFITLLLIDYIKAFDTINNSILFRKFLSLPISSQIQCWIFNFFKGRKQAVLLGGEQSQWLPITWSIVQGSGIDRRLIWFIQWILKPYHSTTA